MNKKIIVFPIVFIILPLVVYAGFLSTTIRFNPSGWEDEGVTITTLTNNPVNVSGDTSFFGNVTIGDGFDNGGIDLTTLGDIRLFGDILIRGDILTITDQEINGSFTPTEDNKFDLGSVSKRWKDGFFSNDIIALTFIGNNSQWSRDGTNVFLTTLTDMVGIGTTNPQATLHVVSSAEGNVHYESNAVGVFEGLESRLQIIADNSGSAAATLFLTNTPGAGTNKHWQIAHTGPTRNNRLAFQWRETAASGDLWGGQEFLTILTGGNGGIGTTTPNQKLTVIGGINQTSGNATINLVRGYTKIHNDSGVVIDLVTTGVYVNISEYFNGTRLSGVDFDDDHAYTILIGGSYEVFCSISFVSGANSEHGMDIGLNSVPQDIHAHRQITSPNAEGDMSIMGEIDADAGDIITCMINDEAGAINDPTIVSSQFNIKRTGERLN